MPGNQPRERDYAFVGSFYAFAIWIGLAVTALVKLTREIKQVSFNTILFGAVLTFVISAFSLLYLSSASAVIVSALMIAAIYAVFSAGLPALLKAVSSKGTNERVLNIATAVICMIAPILMANQEWDDHDRSKKTLARDDAKNYLESCAPNAILFCFGDNDTYPLWYAQEVERVRPDIRIINTSLLGIDWYINQLRYKINQSDSVDVIWRPEQIMGDKRQQLQYQQQEGLKDTYYDLYDVMKNVLGKDDDPSILPVKKFKVPVDSVLVRKNGTVNADDAVTAEWQFELPENDVNPTRDELIILNVIATNAWKRPIYFTSPQVGLGLNPFLRREGLTYRLTPTRVTSDVNATPMMEHMMTKFTNGHADVKGVYFDEENRRHLYTIRQSFGDLARELITKGRLEDAKKVVLKADSLIPNTNVPYGIPSRYEFHNQASYTIMEAAYECGATDLGKKIYAELNRDFSQHMEYFASLGDMTRKQLEDIFMQYNQQNFYERMEVQQGKQPTGRANAYLHSALTPSQFSMAFEINRVFGFLMQYMKPIEEKFVLPPKTNDTANKPDTGVGNLKVKPDTSKPN